MERVKRASKMTLLGAGVLGTALFIADRVVGTRPVKKHPRSDIFNGARFQNLVNEALPIAAITKKHMMQRVSRKVRDPRPPKWENRDCEPTVPKRRVYGDTVVTTFVNHATVLVQTQGLNILTDPIWSMRASPFRFAGPKRIQEPGVALEDLPAIDIVLLSHNHYDHMDIATLRHLHEHDSPLILTHLGNGEYMARRGVPGAVDMRWFETVEVSDSVRITSVPAQHNTERWLTDSNRALWGGFVIETPGGDIYFAGDTGYGPFLEQIRSAYPNGFRLGLLPIGAYAPRWYCKLVHTDPHEAFAMKDELGIEHALAIHFGTFQLGDEPQDEPEDTLREIAEERNDQTFLAFPNGGTLTLE